MTPMPAESSTSGASLWSSTMSPKGAETVTSSPSKTLWCRKLDTSPAGTITSPSPRPAATALTVIAHSSAARPPVRLYWRIWRAPSGSRTATETYWPGRNTGSAPPSGDPSTNDTVSGDSCTRRRTTRLRHTSPSATPVAAYSPFSIAIRVCAMCQ